MFAYLIFLFTVVPIIELALLIKVGTIIGVSNTIAFVLLTGVAGAMLIRVQGFQIIQRIDSELSQGIVPSDALLDGFFVFCGGVLLITPGILTDIAGFLFIIPASRQLIKFWIVQKIRKTFREGRTIRITSYRSSRF